MTIQYHPLFMRFLSPELEKAFRIHFHFQQIKSDLVWSVFTATFALIAIRLKSAAILNGGGFFSMGGLQC